MNNISNYQELVSSKENIQPLRQGRDTSILCAALQAETDTDAQHELEKQRNEFEIRLRSNSSEDPLSDWCDYIHWIEQSFPKQPREGKLDVVLRKCIKKFRHSERYLNDVRFVKLCIKYGNIEGNIVELLSLIHRNGIGVLCAELYIAWAEKYAVDNCFNKANAIYEKGLQSFAQPIELLQEAHKNFQAFLVRKMLNNGETFQPTMLDSNPSEVRQPYNVLQSVTVGQKEVVPNIRTGSNVLGSAGKLKLNCDKDLRPKSNIGVKVFEDPENNYSSSEPKGKLEKLPTKKASTKENTVKPGIWTNKQNKHADFSIGTPAPVSFQVHVDEDSEDNNKKLQTVPSFVLKSHKPKPGYEDDNFSNAPLFYPEPYDATKVPMYCKEQVYAGGLEFQFEELRAIQYRRKMEEKLKRNQIVSLKPFSTEKVMTEYDSLFFKPESHIKLKSEKKKLRVEDSTEKRKITVSQNQRKTLFCDPIAIREPFKTNYVPEENLPTTDYSMNQTIHTKEALSEMQQLWFSKPASPVPLNAKTTKLVGKSILKPRKPCFSLYVDESCLGNLKTTEELEKPLNLTLKGENDTISEGQDNFEKERGLVKLKYQDFGANDDLNPSEGVRKKTDIPYKVKQPNNNCKENVFSQKNFLPAKILISQNDEDDEDKENGVPEDYCGFVGKSNRKVSGILTPAENIEIAPLSDEEVEVDEEEEEGVDFFDNIQCNTTGITETWNFTKAFQFPRGQSTPNERKSIHQKKEFNESVFALESGDNIHEGKNEKESKLNENNETFVVPDERKATPTKSENFVKNLSVIAETSREYKSSTSGSSGANISTLRSSKYYPYTPSETKSVKYSLTSSHTNLHKSKVQSYVGYEASNELSETVTLKTPTSNYEKQTLGTTFDLMEKLKAIDSISNSTCSKEEIEVECVSKVINNLNIEDEKNCEEKKESIDPFCDEVINNLLEEVDFPKPIHSSGYFLLYDIDLSALKVGSSVTLGAYDFDVKKLLGEGSYAKIYKILNTTSGEFMIAKFQKSSIPWEFYITREIQDRIKNKDLLPLFMHVESAYFFKNSSILLTRPVEFGDLLLAINKMKQAKIMCQTLAMYFTCQILNILQFLHSCKIIHGDIKPDNFLLRSIDKKLQLQLIDFGRSIDMSLFPEGTTFTRVVTTAGFTTIEMQTGKPWTYQIDLYGAANCSHCLLFGDYMKVSEKAGVWNISKSMPRYWSKTEWNNFFVTLLNVESCSKLPDLSELIKSFDAIIEESSEIEVSLIQLNNLLNDR